MPELQHILPGRLYELTQDVENPVPLDRRQSKYLRTTEVFPKGSTWVVYREEGSSIFLVDRRPAKRGGEFTGGIMREGELQLSKRPQERAWAEAILPHLVELPLDSPDRIFLAFDIIHNCNLLQKLIEQDIVSPARLVALLRALHPEMSAKETP